MAVVTRGRVQRPVDEQGATRIAGAETDATTHRVAKRGARIVPRESVDAHAEAERIVARAREEAGRIVEAARRDATLAARDAKEEARAAALAGLAAHFLAIKAREERRAEADLDRTAEVAKILAERLVRGAIELDPSRVAVLAKSALSEVRGARRATIEVHPLDADALRVHLDGAGLPKEAIELRAGEGLARGDLRLHTDLGTLDARLSVQLERLAAALRDALRG